MHMKCPELSNVYREGVLHRPPRIKGNQHLHRPIFSSPLRNQSLDEHADHASGNTNTKSRVLHLYLLSQRMRCLLFSRSTTLLARVGVVIPDADTLARYSLHLGQLVAKMTQICSARTCQHTLHVLQFRGVD